MLRSGIWHGSDTSQSNTIQADRIKTWDWLGLDGIGNFTKKKKKVYLGCFQRLGFDLGLQLLESNLSLLEKKKKRSYLSLLFFFYKKKKLFSFILPPIKNPPKLFILFPPFILLYFIYSLLDFFLKFRR